MNKKLHIKKGDMVFVNAGDDKGKTGKVLKVLDDKLLNVAIDFELRFPNEKMIVSDYRNMIISMYMMCRKFIKYISDDIFASNSEKNISSNDESFIPSKFS